MITVLAVAIMVALGAATVLQSMSSYGVMKATTIKETQFKYLAEAAMQHALYRCRTNTNGCAAGLLTCCVNESNFTVNTTVNGVSVNIPAPISIANVGSGTREVNTTIQYAESY